MVPGWTATRILRSRLDLGKRERHCNRRTPKQPIAICLIADRRMRQHGLESALAASGARETLAAVRESSREAAQP